MPTFRCRNFQGHVRDAAEKLAIGGDGAAAETINIVVLREVLSESERLGTSLVPQNHHCASSHAVDNSAVRHSKNGDDQTDQLALP